MSRSKCSIFILLKISDAFIALGQSRGQLLHLFNLPRGRELNNMKRSKWPSLMKVLKNIRAKIKVEFGIATITFTHLTAMFPICTRIWPS